MRPTICRGGQAARVFRLTLSYTEDADLLTNEACNGQS